MNYQENNYTSDSIVRGLVLKVEDYKEYDGLIKVLTPNGLVTFNARGIQKAGSKNARLGLIGQEVEFEYDPRFSSHYLFLIHGKVLSQYPKVRDDLVYLSFNEVVSQFISHTPRPQIFYNPLKTLWRAMDEKNSKVYGVACVILVLMMQEQGIKLHVDSCIECGDNKKITGISLDNGGFVCLNHCGDGERKTPEQLKKIRALFKAGWDNCRKLLTMYTYTIDDLIELMEWYIYLMNAETASQKFFLLNAKKLG